MDDYDAYLYSIDDLELLEEGESDNDVLDNIDEKQVHTDSAVVLVPASPPTREEVGGDKEQSKPGSTASNLMDKCNRSVDICSTLVAHNLTMRSRVLAESVYHTSSTFAVLYLSN